MSEQKQADGFWAGLVGAPLEVVRLIKDDKILLAGMGAAILVTLIAIAAPDAGRFYALVVVGVIVLLVLVRGVSRWAGVEGDATPTGAGPPSSAGPARGNEARITGRARLGDVDMNARTGGNHVTASGRSRVQSLRMDAGGDDTAPVAGSRGKAPHRRRGAGR